MATEVSVDIGARGYVGSTSVFRRLAPTHPEMTFYDVDRGYRRWELTVPGVPNYHRIIPASRLSRISVIDGLFGGYHIPLNSEIATLVRMDFVLDSLSRVGLRFVVREAARILRPGGAFVVVDLARYSPLLNRTLVEGWKHTKKLSGEQIKNAGHEVSPYYQLFYAVNKSVDMNMFQRS